jgi:hypothetical protein
MQTLDLARLSSAEIVAVDNNPVVLDIIAASGYRLRNHFTLPEAAWWVDFYDPLEQTLEKMRVKYASAEGAIALLDANQAETDLYRRHSHSYGYVFYVIQALP